MGPRLPGDRGPHRPPEKKEKALTHNPFAALAAKLEDAGKGARADEPRAPEAPEAAREAPAPEAGAPQAVAPEGREASAPAPAAVAAEVAPETKPAE